MYVRDNHGRFSGTGGISGGGTHAGWAERAAKDVEVRRLNRPDLALPANFGQALFGHPLTSAHFVQLTGAHPGSYIEAEMQGNQMHIHVSHPQYKLHRIIERERDTGNLILHNESFFTQYRKQKGKGWGARVFARQVDGAQEMGIKKIHTYAIRGDDNVPANGYYTWARLGYNTTLKSSMKRDLLAEPEDSPLHALGRHAKIDNYEFRSVTMHEVFDTPGGAEWWKERGGSIDMQFDPTPGSPSHTRLHKYLAVKGINPYAD